MKKRSAFLLSFMIFSSCFSMTDEEKKAFSKTIGHLIYKNLEETDLPLDFQAVSEGFLDSSKGKNPPLTEAICLETLEKIQEESFFRQRKENLAAAEDFLQKNEMQTGVVTVIKNRLQYKVQKIGSGESVTDYSKPLIRFQAKNLDGESFPITEEIFDMDEDKLGLSKGILGMKEGEKRTLFIHPEYEPTEDLLSCTALWEVEVELIQADATKALHTASRDLFELDSFSESVNQL